MAVFPLVARFQHDTGKTRQLQAGPKLSGLASAGLYPSCLPARTSSLCPLLDVPVVLLLADNLTVERGGRAILSGLSFRAESGEAVLLTGPNGAGKTTLLRALAGYIRPLAGRVLLEGGGADLSLAEQSHFIGHLNAVKPSLTAQENLAFWAAYLGASHPPAAALDRLGLGDLGNVPAGYLSAGQRRRLALARLLVARRPLWLLDEPTVSLDAASVALFAELAAEHLAGGGLVVAATHSALGLANARELRLGARAEAA